ncbi:hypothetical protein HanRHA438_Chr02g0085201 [Helianthus annuus]|nr:hypothetical protein HanRHA438_Chr02g0085201 [Helianthus annuus]
MCHLLLISIVSLYVYLCVTRFLSQVSRGSTWLTGSPRPWVELGIAIIVSQFRRFAFRGLNLYVSMVTNVVMFVLLMRYLLNSCYIEGPSFTFDNACYKIMFSKDNKTKTFLNKNRIYSPTCLLTQNSFTRDTCTQR